MLDAIVVTRPRSDVTAISPIEEKMSAYVVTRPRSDVTAISMV